MKKIKKLLTIGLAVLLMLCMSVSLGGCSKSELIPNGKYIEVTMASSMLFKYAKISNSDNYIEIKSDTVRWVMSGTEYYRAKIVEKDNEIYFEGHKWKDMGKEYGYTEDYLVKYYAGEQIIGLYRVVDSVENKQ